MKKGIMTQEMTANLTTSDAALRQRTMHLSVVEAMLAMVMIGLTQNYYVPYLNDLGASKLAIGIGFGSYLLAGGLIQIWAPAARRILGSYKKILILNTTAQALFLIPFAVVGHLFPRYAIPASIVVMFFSAAAGGICASAWADWMSSIVARKRRGAYFGFRTSMGTLSQLAASSVAGIILDRARDILFVYMIIWFVAIVGRLSATCLLFFHYEPAELGAHQPRQISLMDFVRQMHTHSYGRFIFANSVMYLGAYFSSPFFALHMLNDLKFSYFEYSCIQLIAPLATIFSLRLWGRVSDRLGNVMPMRLGATIIMLLPVGWLVSGNFWYLLCLNILAGIAWGGYQLLTFNYSIGELPSGQRLAYISYMNAISAVFFFAGSALGGWIGPMLPAITLYQLHSIFVFSTILRLPAALLFQSLPTDEPAGTRMTAVEKFFFQPRRFIQGRFPR